MAKDRLYKVLEQLNNGVYQDNSIVIETSDYEEEENFNNRIGDKEVFLLCEVLKQNPQIEKVELFLQNIGDDGAIALAEIDTLSSITVHCGIFGLRGACALAKANIKHLSLLGGYVIEDEDLNPREDKDIQLFTLALAQNKSLEIVDLSCICISSKLLVQLIQNTYSIKKIHLNKYFDEQLITDIHINQEQITLHTYKHKEIIITGDQIVEEQ